MSLDRNSAEYQAAINAAVGAIRDLKNEKEKQEEKDILSEAIAEVEALR